MATQSNEGFMSNPSGSFDKRFISTLGNDPLVGLSAPLRNWMLCGVGCYFPRGQRWGS